MKPELLSSFAQDVNISVRTLKAKYGDCIHREGRQSFIDREKFENAFPERSRQGRTSTREVVKSSNLGQVEFHLKRIQEQIQKCKRAVEKARIHFEAAEEPVNKERKLLYYLDEKQSLQVMEIKGEKLTARRNEIIEKKKENLFVYDDEGLLANL